MNINNDETSPALKVDTDEDKLIFKISVENSNAPEKEFIFFDIANGIFESFKGGITETFSFDKLKGQFELYLKALMRVDYFEKMYITKNLKEYCFEKFLYLVQLFTNIPCEKLFMHYQQKPKVYYFKEFLRLTMFPFEPVVCTIFAHDDFELRFPDFECDRKDSDVLKKIFQEMKISDTTKIKSLFIQRPTRLFTYLNLKDCGFTDIELYYRVLENTDVCNFIDAADLSYLKVFMQYCIKEQGELAAINILTKQIDNGYDIMHGIEMFTRYFNDIPEDLKKKILQEGFTSFNCMVLQNLHQKA